MDVGHHGVTGKGTMVLLTLMVQSELVDAMHICAYTTTSVSCGRITKVSMTALLTVDVCMWNESVASRGGMKLFLLT